MHYEVKTNIKGDGVIEQLVTYDDRQNPVEVVTRQIIDTREAQVRQALIALGWTPPQEKPKE